MDILTTVLSGAALLLAIASPIITAVINALSRRRDRESEFYLNRKAEIIENYVRSTGKFLRYKNIENACEYGAAYGEILLYVPKELRQEIIALNDQVETAKTTKSNEYYMFNTICECLSKETPRVKNHKRNSITNN